MTPITLPSRGLLMAGLVLCLAGCGDGHGPEAEAGHAGGHAHSPKYGGRLVELGEHEANLELVLDPAGGRLTAYVLDAHAENFIRLPVESFVVMATVNGTQQPLTFKPVPNPATGEKVGDTSQFEATAEWLKTTPAFSGTLKELPVKSKTYRNVQFSIPQ